MKSGLSFLGLILATGVLVGGSCWPSSCVQFDSQSIRAHHDEAKDRVDVLLVYRGLTADDDNVVGKVVKQLEDIRASRKTFAILDNFYTVSLQKHRSHVPERAEDVARSALVRNVEITNGALWRDECARLCGSQLIRFSHVSEILAAANAAIAENLRDELDKAMRSKPATMPAPQPTSPLATTPEPTPATADDPPGASRATKEAAPASLDDWLTTERLQRFVTAGEAGYRFLSLRGSAIVISLPVTSDDAVQFRGAVLAAFRHDLEKRDAEKLWLQIDLLARNRIAMDQVGDDLQIVVGDPAGPELSIECPSKGLTGADLGAELSARGWTVGGPEGETQARAEYEAFRAQP